jgi:hypothetical protein
MRLKLSLVELGLIVGMFGVLAALMLPSHDYDHAHRYPSATSGSGTNLADVDGEYFMGDGLGMNLRLSILPDGRYSFVSSGCTGVHHRECGHVRQTEGRYVLSPSEPSEPVVERTLVLVRRDRRCYLIPPGKMQEFRDAITEGREPRDEVRGSFYVRRPVEPADGLPDTPVGWANDPREILAGRVLEVSAVGLAKVGRVRVDLGVEQGILPGEILTVQRRGNPVERRFIVVSVENGSCVADECYPGMSDHPLELGQAVVTARVRGGKGRGGVSRHT